MATTRVKGKQVTYKAPGAGSVTRNLFDKLGELPTRADFATEQDYLNAVASVNKLGSEAVEYTPFGTGAVATTVEAMFNQAVYANGYATVQQAVDALPSNGVLVFPPDTKYELTAPLSFTGKSNILLWGYGATVKCGASRIESYFDLTGTDGVKVKGFTFDQRKASMPVYTALDYGNLYNCPIYVDGSATSVEVEDCTFLDLYTSAIFMRIVDFISVRNCTFTSGVQTQDQWMQHIHCQTVGEMDVAHNRFLNDAFTNPAVGPCGIYGSSITVRASIDDNYFNYCGRDNTGTHRLGVIDFYFDCKNVSVTNNTADNTMAQFMRLSDCATGLIQGNRVTVNANAEFDYSTLTIESGAVGALSPRSCTNIQVLNNVFLDGFGRAAYTVGVLAYDWGRYVQNITVSNNLFRNTRRPVFTQGPYENLAIQDNQFFNVAGAFRGGILITTGTGITSLIGTEANSFFEGLSVCGNNWTGNNLLGVSVELGTATTAFVGQISVARNKIKSRNAATASAAINIEVGSTNKNENIVVVENNQISQFTLAFQIRNCTYVSVRHNYVYSPTTFINQSGNTVYEQYGNNYQFNKLVGTATLVAGSALNVLADCRTGDVIRLTHYTAGGTPGIVSAVNVGNGVFDIVSTSATDTSVIAWEVVH